MTSINVLLEPQETSAVGQLRLTVAYGYRLLEPEADPIHRGNITIQKPIVGERCNGDGSRKVLRRINGFLVEMLGEEAKVCLIHDGKPYTYYLPSSHLTKASIKAENQPFEMDEIELTTEGSYLIGYEFRPLAKSSDAFQDSFRLDQDREDKRNLIFRTFKNAKA